MANGAPVEEKQTRRLTKREKKAKHHLPEGTRLKSDQQDAVWRAEAADWETYSKAFIEICVDYKTLRDARIEAQEKYQRHEIPRKDIPGVVTPKALIARVCDKLKIDIDDHPGESTIYEYYSKGMCGQPPQKPGPSPEISADLINWGAKKIQLAQVAGEEGSMTKTVSQEIASLHQANGAQTLLRKRSEPHSDSEILRRRQAPRPQEDPAAHAEGPLQRGPHRQGRVRLDDLRWAWAQFDSYERWFRGPGALGGDAPLPQPGGGPGWGPGCGVSACSGRPLCVNASNLAEMPHRGPFLQYLGPGPG